MKSHNYAVKTTWTGNRGTGTSAYTAYSRDHEISGVDKSAIILGSSDPAFRGDKTRFNPEELLLSALSTCHMLWYLHLCATFKVVVVDYIDEATGTMEETMDGSGQFSEVALYPRVTIADKALANLAVQLHQEAHHMCFIARSCNFKVSVHPNIN